MARAPTFQNDYIFRYWPRYDEETFMRELDYTSNSLEKYYPSQLKSQIRTFKIFKAVATLASIGIIGALCYKLEKFPIIRNITVPWVPGAIKVGLMLGGVYAINIFLEGTVTREFHHVIYEQLRPNYRMYKFSGDLRHINPQVSFEDLPESDEHST